MRESEESAQPFELSFSKIGEAYPVIGPANAIADDDNTEQIREPKWQRALLSEAGILSRKSRQSQVLE